MSDHKKQIKWDWSAAPYYELAEKHLSPFWSEDSPFIRLFNMLDLTNVVELGCGHGRHAAYIREHYSFGHMTLIDINQPNIAFCQTRFKDDGKFSFVENSGSDLAPLISNAYSAVFCYDAMVHFEYDDVFSYLKDIYRILLPDGRALLHHSNNDKNPGALYSKNPHWRNFMSASLFAHVAMRMGFLVIEQQLLEWGGEAQLDCVTLLAKSGSTESNFAEIPRSG
jgi:ubiquinone/menaquinone biosynthesis C-methylase UbiE